MSGEWCWRTNCTLSPFSLRLMESQGERETCIFSSLRTAIFQNVQSLQYIRKDVMVISVPYECPNWEIIVLISCTVWHHVYYDYLNVTRSVQLPTAVKSAGRSRKNGRLRKHHYSKIQNAGDCLARTGVRGKGFKFGSLPHDPGGITCMVCCWSTLELLQRGNSNVNQHNYVF